MTDEKYKLEPQTGGPAKKDARQNRLKLALRENLKRRKSQARGRGQAADSSDEPSPHDRSEKKPGQ